MKFLYLALLPWLALAEGANAGRKLDADWVDPTDAPTVAATTQQPSAYPTVSPAPSVSFAPTAPSPPECDGAWPFCYDGHGTGRGYTTCYAVKESEFCGEMDFMIEGMDATTRGPYDFSRCPNVWDWFVHCISSSYQSCKLQPGGSFYHNRWNYPKISKHHDSKRDRFEVKMWSRGISGSFRWYCDLEEDAEGIYHFASWVKEERLFQVPLGTCDTPAPSESHEPTMSPQPSSTPAPKCNATGMAPYTPASGRYMSKRCKWGGGNLNCFMISGGCKYTTWSDGLLKSPTTYDSPEEWLHTGADLLGGTPVDLSGSLTGKRIPSGDWIEWTENRRYYASIVEGEGVSGGAKTWYWRSKGHRNNFLSIFRGVSRSYGWAWETNDDVKCGSGPFCFDDKDKTICRIDPVSENCGEYDFLVEGLDVYKKSGNVLQFFGDCIESYGCYAKKIVPVVGGGVARKTQYDSKDPRNKRYQIKMWGSGLGGDGYALFNCPSSASANKARDIWDEVYKERLASMKSWQCTESPTMSPTACSDSFFNNPPLNVAVVVDTSYSTYEFDFGGDTEVGDLNDDGKAGTILDAEIAAIEALLNTILEADELNNDNVDIGLITFNTEGRYEGHFKPLNEDDSQLNSELLDVIHSFSTLKSDNEVLLNNVGFTNFDDALDTAIEYFSDPSVSSDRTNLMVFLSDGKPNVRGDGDNEPWCPGASNCADAPANLPDEADTPAWESGKLSFCYSGDTTTCFHPGVHGYEDCARNDGDCLGADAAKMFDSELAELDKFDVHRLAIGVGQSSDISEQSGLWLIDNNPMKTSHNVLPRQVLNADDLINALRDLCPENTPRPTGAPSASPTAAPTVSPTPGPTSSPTTSPTGLPSESPTDDYCEYSIVDFSEGSNGEETGLSYVRPYEWQNYGLKINAVTDEMRDSGKQGRAFYHQTGDANAGKGIIIPEAGGGSNPGMNPNGGDITITLDLTMDKIMRFDFMDVEDGGSIYTFDTDGNEVGEPVGILAIDGHQEEVVVPVEGIYQVVVTFYGHGALTGMNVCRDPKRTPSPVGLSPEFDTEEPTAAPTIPECPDDVKVLGKIGDTDFEEVPIRIISQEGDVVTIEISSAFTRDVQYLYTQHFDASRGSQQCVAHSQITEEWNRRLTVSCMKHAPISIVRVLVSDGSLSPDDTAEVPECCDGPENDNNPKVLYTFQVYCSTQCVDW